MELDGKQLESLLPHRPPILMLESVVDIVPGESGTGIREFKEGDSFFEGHFPGLPILPGVLTIEAFAQTAMAVFLAEDVAGDGPAKLGFLGKVNEMAFFEKIVPGRKVGFSIKVDRQVGPFAFVSCKASEEGVKFAFGQITLKIGN
mgnify:CR=1 FL=1